MSSDQNAATPLPMHCMMNQPALRCSSCRHVFRCSTAWKQHRRTGVCNLDRLGLDAGGVWRIARRIRVNQHNSGTTPAAGPEQHATKAERLTSYQKGTP